MKEPRRRSDAQNRHLWAALTDVANQVEWPVNGRLVKMPPRDWKDVFTAALHREQRIAQGLEGGFVMLGQRTSRMSVQEMSDLLALISAFGDERGVKWSEPDAAV